MRPISPFSVRSVSKGSTCASIWRDANWFPRDPYQSRPHRDDPHLRRILRRPDRPRPAVAARAPSAVHHGENGLLEQVAELLSFFQIRARVPRAGVFAAAARDVRSPVAEPSVGGLTR